MGILNKYNKMPIGLKLILGIIPLLLVINSYVQFRKEGTQNKDKFFKGKISSLIVSSNSFHGRSVEFHLDNGLKLYFSPPVEDKIKLGDSISKEPNTYVYKVYRRDSFGTYIYLATYNASELI